MKRKLFLIGLLVPFVLHAQSVRFKIMGFIKTSDKAKYAYLSTPFVGDLFMVAPIKDGAFQFVGADTLGNKIYKEACIFLDERGDVTLEEMKAKLKALVWVFGQDPKLKRFVLEDIQLKIDDPNIVRDAMIVSGGLLSKISDESSRAILENKIKEFILKYPDSPVSLNMIRRSIPFYELPIKSELEERWGVPIQLFQLLSERLRNTTQGSELKKRIIALDKI